MVTHRRFFGIAVGAYHVTVGALLWKTPDISSITSLHLFGFEYGWAIFLLAGVLAFGSLSSSSVAWLVPQQLLLYVTAVGCVLATAQGAYPDGYVPLVAPHVFIGADQGVYILVAVVHHALEMTHGER